MTPQPEDASVEDTGDGERRLDSVLQGERETRAKLERLLELRRVEIDLHKEVRAKTELLWQLEQETTSNLRRQLEVSSSHVLYRWPKNEDGVFLEAQARIEELEQLSETRAKAQKQVEAQLSEALQRIGELERQLAEASAQEARDKAEAQLVKQKLQQVEEEYGALQEMLEQMKGKTVMPTEVPRLQMLLCCRDKQLEEMAIVLDAAQADLGKSRSESEMLRHQLRIVKKQMAESTEKVEASLATECKLRADVFQHQAFAEQLKQQLTVESKRSAELAEKVVVGAEQDSRINQLEQQLAEIQTRSVRAQKQIHEDYEHKIIRKDHTIQHQTKAMEVFREELKVRQEELEKLMNYKDIVDAAALSSPAGATARTRLPPLDSAPKAAEDLLAKEEKKVSLTRSMESLHKQIRIKDVKIGKMGERLHTLTEMLEKRDQQLEELMTARRDRELLQQRLADIEEAARRQPHAVTHVEAEKRLLEQERKLLEKERLVQELENRLLLKESSLASVTVR